MIILDTNVLSALMLGKPDADVAAWIDRQAQTSVWTTTVTIFEIRYGLAIMPVGQRRTARMLAFERVVEETLDHRIVSFDQGAAEEAAILMAARQQSGRASEWRDTMIAGIALAQRA